MKITNAIMPVVGAAMVLLPVAGAIAHDSKYGTHEPILQRPIADVENNYWYDYLSDVREAEHELKKDLARATDQEDRQDAMEEYQNEIADANKDYRKEMKERGYREGRVYLGE